MESVAASPSAPRTFPVPTALVDALLPSLKDTETRVLLVVLRQTLGRLEQDGGYRAADWLSHSQLRARTGRAGEAVSAAVDALVRRGLICVQDEHGMRLGTARERRRTGRRHGRLLFSPGPALALLSTPASERNVAGKPKTTDYKKDTRTFRISENATLRQAADARLSGESERQRIEAAKRLIRERLATLYSRGA